MAGAAGLEPVTSAVTGQRSNQLSYAPAMGNETIGNVWPNVKFWMKKFWVFAVIFYGRWEKFRIKIRAADAKEVGVGNPAEETCCYPNAVMLQFSNGLSTTYSGIAI
jgi:hypothetical protein